MIEEAIKIEEDYLYNKLYLNQEQSLLEMLKPVGYSDLEAYFFDKTSYKIKQLKIESNYTGDMLGIPEAISDDLEHHRTATYFPYSKNVFMWHGNEELDLELCDKFKIDVLDMNYTGGNIISSPEDYSMGIMVPNSIDVSLEYYLKGFYKIYKKYFEDVRIDNNDILINGKKVQGAIFFENNGMFFYGTEITFTDNSELIKKFCKKPAIKIAGYIDNNVLNKETLQREVQEWLN